MPSEADLHTWIETSRQHRRALKTALWIFACADVLVWIADHHAGFVLLLVAAVIAVAGFWIVGSHIADWEGQLSRRR